MLAIDKTTDKTSIAAFTGYQKFVAGLLAFLQLVVILDFMVMSPLSVMIMPSLGISPTHFGIVVSAYAFSAGLSGFLTAGFADRFDRKKLLLFFYGGFICGTLWCGLARSFEEILAARIFTGIFGGVIGSVLMAITTDLFAPSLRGRVVGIIQTAVAVSQVMGIPVALHLSNYFDWHAPFFLIAGIGAIGGVVLAWHLQPVDAHLKLQVDSNAVRHLISTVTDRRYLPSLAATCLLASSGFMLMPFTSVFSVNNLGIDLDCLPTIYLTTGISMIFLGLLVGKLTDRFGNMPVFYFGSVMTIVMVLIYTQLSYVPLLVVIAINVVMFLGIFSRMIPYQTLAASVPDQNMRGSFNAVSASLQQLAGGVASIIAGLLVSTSPDGKLVGFPHIGYVVVCTSIVAMFLVTQINKGLQTR